MRIFSSILLMTLLFQSVLFSGGLYGVIKESEAMLCSCNHGSHNEKHASEDSHFGKSPPLKGAGMQASAATAVGATPSCHSPKEGEAHLCTCKKARANVDYLLSSSHHTWFTDASFLFAANHPELILILARNGKKLTKEYPFHLVKPPSILPA